MATFPLAIGYFSTQHRLLFHHRKDYRMIGLSMFYIAKIYFIFFTGLASGNLWDIWGKLVNDWDNAKKKLAYLKVRFNYFVIIIYFMYNIPEPK
jgi:hypothetical protein